MGQYGGDQIPGATGNKYKPIGNDQSQVAHSCLGRMKGPQGHGEKRLDLQPSVQATHAFTFSQVTVLSGLPPTADTVVSTEGENTNCPRKLTVWS